MTEQSLPALRMLAAKIATSYARANPMPVDALPGVIQSAYQGLLRCAQPPAPPAPPVKAKGGRGASRNAPTSRRRKG